MNKIHREEWRQGYKVVLKGKKIHYSATYVGRYCPPNLKTRFKYQEGKITKRRKGWGPMAVFSTLKHAQDFATWCHFPESSTLVIFSCLYKRSKCKYLFVPGEGFAYCLPVGTDLADKVKLLGEVIGG